MLLTVVMPAGGGAWASDTTDASGSYRLELLLAGECEGTDSIPFLLELRARDHRAARLGSLFPERPFLGCGPELQTLWPLQLYRQVFRSPQPVAGSLTASALGAGSVTCAATTTGPRCWGLGWGDPPGGMTLVPALVPGAPPLTQVEVGGTHMCGLDEDGVAWCWGGNSYGHRGVPGNPAHEQALKVETELRFVRVATGYFHTCGLATTGQVHCWGDGRHLGTGVEEGKSHIPLAIDSEHTFIDLSVGLRHSCAVDTTGGVHCWGYSYRGELGAGEATGQWHYSPLPVDSELAFVQVTLGSTYACALTTAGEAHCWGTNWDGQLGIGESALSVGLAPMPVVGGHAFAGITAGNAHACGWTVDGVAWCWGSNDTGQLGADTGTCTFDSPSQECSRAPVQVDGPHRFDGLAAGETHSCGIDHAGSLHCWGLRDRLGMWPR